MYFCIKYSLVYFYEFRWLCDLKSVYGHFIGGGNSNLILMSARMVRGINLQIIMIRL